MARVDVHAHDAAVGATQELGVRGVLQGEDANVARASLVVVKVVYIIQEGINSSIFFDKQHYCLCLHRREKTLRFNSHDPKAAANRSLYAGFQHSAVISIPLARSKVNFQSGSSVPSVSRNSSEASSQYLKSGEENILLLGSHLIANAKTNCAYPERCRCTCFGSPSSRGSWLLSEASC